MRGVSNNLGSKTTSVYDSDYDRGLFCNLLQISIKPRCIMERSLIKIILLIVLLITLFSTSVQCLLEMKMWRVNTNVTIESRYWDDLVTVGSFTFNGSMTHAVAIPSVKRGLDECELIYPLDKLSPSVSSDLYNTTEEGECVDEKLLKKMDRVFWLDPRNWGFYPLLYESAQAIPHIERIPCIYDRALIPNKPNTFIVLPQNPIQLAALKFGRRYISRYDMAELLKTESFTRHFIVKSSLGIADILNITDEDSCEDRTGCECGTRIYEQEICAFVKDDCGKNFSCETPIKPAGYCCPICGGVVIAMFDKDRFLYNRLVAVVRKFVENQSGRLEYNVSIHISKISKLSVQIILLPRHEYSNDLLDLTMGLAEYLDKANDLGIEQCIASNAGKPKGDQWGWSNIFVGLAIVSIMVVVLVYVNDKLKLVNCAISLCKGLSSKQQDKNLQNKFTVSKEEEEVNNKQTEKIADSAPSEQHETQSNPMDTTDRLI